MTTAEVIEMVELTRSQQDLIPWDRLKSVIESALSAWRVPVLDRTVTRYRCGDDRV